MAIMRATTLPSWIRQHLAGLRALLVLTVILGIGYPLLMTGVAQVFASDGANGSIVRRDGAAVGSALIGQNFTDKAGNPLPRYFQSRPSQAGDTGYDPTSSGASNKGPQDSELIADITKRRQQVAAFNGVSAAAVPPDAVTASGSGLDPHISPEYAAIQVRRVATARHLTPAQVDQLVTTYTSGRDLGFIGSPTVNVIQLNLALDQTT